ncbi:MAG: PDDEXK nuclease domain-containing protein [Bacilli bacterium]|nr:PDDEXK nuclease domain-containing protein [Bacilli bacterium]
MKQELLPINSEIVQKDNAIDNKDIIQVLSIIQNHRDNAYRKANEEQILAYFELGKFLSNKIKEKQWGTKVIEMLAQKISKVYPELIGFTRSGLYRMIQFYETYRDNIIVSPLVRQISWTNNILIFSHKSSMEEKEFYIRLCIKNNYSKRELERQIASHYYERYMLSGDTTENKLPIVGEEDCPNTRILDTYCLEFLDLPNKYSEKDLQTAIVENLKDFILEIGKDFTFIAKEFRVSVGNTDNYIDLLFYNRAFQCLVAFELKIDKFIPEYISKMNFYLEALDREYKRPNENPSIGIILCTDVNKTVVEYATARSTSPAYVSSYSTKLIDEKLLKQKLTEYQKIFNK